MYALILKASTYCSTNNREEGGSWRGSQWRSNGPIELSVEFQRGQAV